jgi:phosphohistidine phosphatase
MTELFLMRHAIAVPRGEEGYAEDADRPLTEEGRKKLSAVCRGLSHLVSGWDVILTSPLVRAQQTASAVAAHFDLSHLVQEVPVLSPGHTTKQLADFLKTLASAKTILAVGHEPSLSQHLSCFLFGTPRGKFEFKKSGIACLEFLSRPEEGEGILSWFMVPAQLSRLGKKK